MKKKTLTPLILGGIFFFMLGLSFAAVPLYDLFCRVTGFGGTTQVSKEAPKVSKEVLEAAKVDGAGPITTAFRIKIPMLIPTIKLSVFLSLLGSLQLFDIIMPLTGGGPSNVTHSMVSYLYYFGVMRMKVGFGSAVGVVIFLICLFIAIGYQRTLMRDDNENKF